MASARRFLRSWSKPRWWTAPAVAMGQTCQTGSIVPARPQPPAARTVWHQLMSLRLNACHVPSAPLSSTLVSHNFNKLVANGNTFMCDKDKEEVILFKKQWSSKYKKKPKCRDLFAVVVNVRSIKNEVDKFAFLIDVAQERGCNRLSRIAKCSQNNLFAYPKNRPRIGRGVFC